MTSCKRGLPLSLRPQLAFALTALSWLLFPRVAPAAQEPRPGWEISPHAGFLAFDQDFRVSDGVRFRGLKDSPFVGGRVGYIFNRRLGLEASFGYNSHSLEATEQAGSSALDVSYWAAAAEALFHLTSGNVVPFVAAGLGGTGFQVEADAAPDESSTALLGSVGGGLKLPVNSSVLVRVDARDFLVRRAERRVTSLFGGDGEIRHTIAFSGGVSIRFGGPKDQDRDGVYDDRDACPGTAADLPVDERGCVPKIPEGPPPVKTDADGDGVSDALDRCPRTPAGAIVDLEGCPVEAEPEGTPRGGRR